MIRSRSWAAIVVGAVTLALALQAAFPTLIVMHGSSMEPTLSSGDVVACSEDVGGIEDVERGDLVAFQWGEGGLYVHRVVGVMESHRPPAITTQGDANPDQREYVPIGDVRCVVEPVAADGGDAP